MTNLLSSTVKQGYHLLMLPLFITSPLISIGILTYFPFIKQINVYKTNLSSNLGPTNPKRNTLILVPFSA